MVSNLTSQVDSRCAELVNEGSNVCNDVMGQITERFQALTGEVTVEVRRQCETTKQVTTSLLSDLCNPHYPAGRH